jgi:hypothetical protein
MSSEAIPTLTFEWFVTTVDFRMSFQVVLADKTFLTMGTLELTISKMSLNVRFDIFLSAEPFITRRVETDPF